MTYKQSHIRRRHLSSRSTATSLTDRLYRYQGTCLSIPHTAQKCTVILKQSTIRLTSHGLTTNHISNPTKQQLELYNACSHCCLLGGLGWGESLTPFF